jgi:sarcosine oxidase subunit alpha
MLHLERLLQTRWRDLRVHVSSESDHWAGLAVAGPRARAVLSSLIRDIDFTDAAYPFMGVREGTLGAIPVRTARLSFSGEQAWEVFAPADHGPALWRAVAEACAAEGGGPYGLEALDCLRVEKGHVTGRELDGRTTLDDLGLGRMASKTKPFIGSVLRLRPDLTRPDRPRLIGLRPVAEGDRFRAGSVLCEPGHVAGHGVGWVSSVADSPQFGWIALGFAAGGPDAWIGRRLIAADPINGAFTEVEAVVPCFYDPSGDRMHG